MKKWLLSLCMVLALAACDEKKETAQANSKPVIKIGAILPLTGSQADMGRAAQAGMQKALDDKDKSSLHYDYQFVFEDNQAKLSSMPAIANKMVMQDNVDVMGTVTSAMARVVVPISDQKGKVLYAYSIEEENYSAFGKYTFIQGISSMGIVDKAIKIIKQQNADNIAIFAQNIGVQAAIIRDFENRLTAENIKYVVHVTNQGETDFRLMIAQDKNNGFTKFFVMMFPPEKDIVLKQLIEASVEQRDILGFCLDMGKTTELYENIPAVIYDCGTDDFVETIQKEYNIDSTHSSAEFYDFVSLMIEAYEALYKEGQKPTAEEVTAYIHNKKSFPCMSGQCVVHPNGFIINDPIIRIYQNGKWVKVEE